MKYNILFTGIFAEKNVSSFCKHFFSKNISVYSKNISVYAIFNDQSFNDTLTTNVVSLNNWAQTFLENFKCGDGFACVFIVFMHTYLL